MKKYQTWTKLASSKCDSIEGVSQERFVSLVFVHWCLVTWSDPPGSEFWLVPSRPGPGRDRSCPASPAPCSAASAPAGSCTRWPPWSLPGASWAPQWGRGPRECPGWSSPGGLGGRPVRYPGHWPRLSEPEDNRRSEDGQPRTRVGGREAGWKVKMTLKANLEWP